MYNLNFSLKKKETILFGAPGPNDEMDVVNLHLASKPEKGFTSVWEETPSRK